MATAAIARDIQEFTVSPVTPSIGAVVEGIDLGAELSDGTIAEIRDALVQHKVLFFRGQDITTEQHIAFGRRFGELEIHPMSVKQEHPEIFNLRTRTDEGAMYMGKPRYGADEWHSDVTWREVPSFGSILRCRIMPEVGGDTMWADMTAAYDGLSPAMKDWVCSLTALHDGSGFATVMGISREEWLEQFPLQEHPVVRTIPETGAKVLYVNRTFTRSIKGLSQKESDWLLDHLYAQASIPEYQVRLRWQKNTFAFWDNRQCQHYAIGDYYSAMRHVERVTIMGTEKPFLDPAR